MARTIKFLIVLIVLLFTSKAYSEPMSLSTLVSVQDVPFETCTKVFKINTENLFYLALASINANRFNILEIQSKNGYILFNAVNKEFLASIIRIDETNSILKITPTNNLYYFQPGIVINIFKYIELNSSLKPIVIPVK